MANETEQAFFVALEGCTFAQLNGDLGRHMYNVSLSGLTSFLQVFESASKLSTTIFI